MSEGQGSKRHLRNQASVDYKELHNNGSINYKERFSAHRSVNNIDSDSPSCSPPFASPLRSPLVVSDIEVSDSSLNETFQAFQLNGEEEEVDAEYLSQNQLPAEHLNNQSNTSLAVVEQPHTFTAVEQSINQINSSTAAAVEQLDTAAVVEQSHTLAVAQHPINAAVLVQPSQNSVKTISNQLLLNHL